MNDTINKITICEFKNAGTSTGRFIKNNTCISILDSPMTDTSLHIQMRQKIWSIKITIDRTTTRRNKLIKRQRISKIKRKTDRQLVIDQLTKEIETMKERVEDLRGELLLLEITGL